MDDPTRAFVRGRGAFVEDLHLPGTLHLKVVRSPYARARLVRVKGGITHEDLPAALESVGELAKDSLAGVAQPVLASQYVCYAGQPIAAVVGKDPYDAADRTASVEADYEPLRAVVDPDAAVTAEPIHPGTLSNVASQETRGRRFPPPKAPVVLEAMFANERVTPNPIEPRGILAQWEGSRLTVWASTQSVHAWREGLAGSLGLSTESVRVIAADTGGAFGSKGGLYPEYVIAAHAARTYGRPVKWVESRLEHLQATEQGRGVRARVKVFAERTGRVLGLQADLLVDSGAYGTGVGMPGWIGSQLTGPYAIRKAHVEGRAVLTNKAPLGPYRGAGRPEAAFFMERTMDLLADELKKDPVAVRRANASPRAFASPLGVEVPPFRPFLDAAVRALEYRKRADREKAGFATFLLVPGVAGGETARIVARDGRVTVWPGGQSHGQGHEVFVRDLLSEELGVPADRIDVAKGDTDVLGEGVGSWGSRSAMLIGAAVLDAARAIKRQVARKAGRYSADALLRGTFDATAHHKLRERINTLGANLVTATVDPTGLVRVRLCAAYYDVGRVLNRPMVEGQIVGGSVQGIGQVLYEEARYDDDGNLLTISLADAGLPTAMEADAMFVVKLRTVPSNLPHGAKGVGESPTIGVPPALVRALERRVGRRLTRTPVRPEELARPPKRKRKA